MRVRGGGETIEGVGGNWQRMIGGWRSLFVSRPFEIFNNNIMETKLPIINWLINIIQWINNKIKGINILFTLMVLQSISFINPTQQQNPFYSVWMSLNCSGNSNYQHVCLLCLLGQRIMIIRIIFHAGGCLLRLKDMVIVQVSGAGGISQVPSLSPSLSIPRVHERKFIRKKAIYFCKGILIIIQLRSFQRNWLINKKKYQ